MSTSLFKPGTLIEMTSEARAILIDRYKRYTLKQTRGMVVGPHPNLDHCIMVRLEGEKRVRSFDASYWSRSTPIEPAERAQLKAFMLWARRRKVGPHKRVTDLTEGQVEDLVVEYLTETKPLALHVPTWRPRLGDDLNVYMNPVTGIGGGLRGQGIVMAVTKGGRVRVRFDGKDLMFRWGLSGSFTHTIDKWSWYHIERV
jgi:hypothetical protein